MHKYQDKKIMFSLLIITVFAGLVGPNIHLASKPSNSLSANVFSATDNLISEKKVLPEVTVGLVGDIMLDRDVRKRVVNNLDGDYSKLFVNADFLKSPDVMFANLEGPVSDTGTDKHNLYSFRMDPKVISVIKDSGIDVVSFSNNHVGDWGRPAFEDTIKRLRAESILVCGAGLNRMDAETPATITIEDYKIGFLCFTDVGPDSLSATDENSGILLASDQRFSEIISEAKKNVDTLVVSFHWGEEYKKIHNARQEELAKRAIDAGADLVEGEHPHVVEDTSEYKNVPIVYSLGNFIFDQYFSSDTMHGLFVKVTFLGDKIINLSTHKTVLNSNSQVSLEE